MKDLTNYISQSEKVSSIDDYIKEITTHENHDEEYDYLDNIILDHIDIHYIFNYRLVTEEKIYESDRSFPQQHKLVKSLLNEIHKEKKDDYIVHFDDLDFVEDIYLHFRTNNRNSLNSAYVYDNEKYEDYNTVRWDSDKNKFRFAEIFIYNYDKYSEGIEEMLYHETKHLWDDYIEISKKGKFLSDTLKKSLDIKFQKEDIEDIIREIIYYSEKYETSAYVTQLNGVISKSYIDMKEAFNDIRNCEVYQNYKFLYYIMSTDEYKEKLLENVSNKEYNRMKKNIKKAWHDIVNVTYEVCCSHIQKQRMTSTSKNHRIKK